MDTQVPTELARAEQALRPTRTWRTIVIFGFTLVLFTTLFQVHSYWWSESLTLYDFTLTTDEGLISLNVPLTQLATGTKAQWNFTIYKRDQQVWTAGVAGKTPLRSWMTILDQARCTGGMFLGFGYWKGAWHSQSRPGPFVVVFSSVWFIAIVLFGAFAFYFRKIHFSLRSLLLTVTLVAALLGLVVWLR